MSEITLPVVDITKELKDLTLPDVCEYNYWEARKNRIFYIDYEVMEDYELIELSKTIIQMNMSEMNVPKEDLKPITIFIQSYGGDLEQSFYFADLIMSSRIPIHTVAMGAAMSAGFIIFLAGHKRWVFNHSQLLVHQGSAAFEGTASEIEQAQKNYKKQLDEMKAYILNRCEIPEKIFTKNKMKDWYLSVEEITAYKIADVIENLDEVFE